mmetsp:Transcript_39877/g.120025  ORF Transcript_39877/g.120025 Transcript_39877/m.120025 type:complete len:231 (-) Transcript_39877:9-701(-)
MAQEEEEAELPPAVLTRPRSSAQSPSFNGESTSRRSPRPRNKSPVASVTSSLLTPPPITPRHRSGPPTKARHERQHSAPEWELPKLWRDRRGLSAKITAPAGTAMGGEGASNSAGGEGDDWEEHVSPPASERDGEGGDVFVSKGRASGASGILVDPAATRRLPLPSTSSMLTPTPTPTPMPSQSLRGGGGRLECALSCRTWSGYRPREWWEEDNVVEKEVSIVTHGLLAI